MGEAMKHFPIFVCAWFGGWGTSLGVHITLMDWLGLEAYIAYCRENWIEISYLWGVGAILFFGVVVSGAALFLEHKVHGYSIERPDPEPDPGSQLH